MHTGIRTIGGAHGDRGMDYAMLAASAMPRAPTTLKLDNVVQAAEDVESE
jgi:hypothetical protein